MRKPLIVTLGLVLLIGASSHGALLADDLTPPDWRGEWATTMQHWEFTIEPMPLTRKMPPDGQPPGVNPYGVPTIRCVNPDPISGSGWYPFHGARQGVWRLDALTGSYLEAEIPNAGEPLPKEVWVQVTYFNVAGAPSVEVETDLGNMYSPYHDVAQNLKMGWTHHQFLVEMSECPKLEKVRIVPPANGVIYIDQVVIDTECCGGHPGWYFEKEEQLPPPDPPDDEDFGGDLTIVAGGVVVGERRDSAQGFAAGAAYVYRWEGDALVLDQKLLAPDARPGDAFGSSLAGSGDVLAVGAPKRESPTQAGAGRVYIYRRDATQPIGAQWGLEQVLELDHVAVGAGFGWDVAIDGAHLVVGAPWDHGLMDRTGAAYVFEYDGSQWTLVSQLTALDGATSDRFGFAVGVNGDVIAVGAPRHGGAGFASGATYVFRSSDGWDQQAQLRRDFGPGLQGAALDVEPGRILIGAAGGWGSASMYLYEPLEEVWVQEVEFSNPVAANTAFGTSVSLDSGVAVVGAPHFQQGSLTIGAAHVYAFSDGIWQEVEVLTNANPIESQRFGSSVANRGTRVAVGAPGYDHGRGGLFWFERTSFSLLISPNRAAAGDLVTLSMGGGAPGSSVLLAVVDVNHDPYFQAFYLGVFDDYGLDELDILVPPGLEGTFLHLQSYGFDWCGYPEESPATLILLQ